MWDISYWFNYVFLLHFRYLSHYAEIVQELRIIGTEFGLTVLEYKDNPVPSIASSKKTFQRALVIVAAHGAGLANMMFTTPGSLIVEALCHNPRLIYCFSRQAAVLGHLYAGILPQRHCRDTQPHAVTWVIKDFLNKMLKTKPTDPSWVLYEKPEFCASSHDSWIDFH